MLMDHDDNALRRALVLSAVLVIGLSTGCQRSKVIDSFPDEYVGIGVELTMKDDLPMITRILSDSPAQQAGLEVGDKIITIDEQPTASMSFGEIVMHVRGKPGSQLSLKAKRGTQTIWVVLPRGSLKKQSAGYENKPESP